ncbi:MAG: site-specific integrase [Bradyrhizobiaceae bacterium]|nr:MAG: site-specific integrase [Bradyrhizobiaceae bacterium]
MVLAMSRPWKHPDSGVYWFRKRVPEELRSLVGKREEKRSLQTKDPTEAKRRHADVVAEVEAKWTNLRNGPRSLSEREAHEFAQAIYDRWFTLHKDNPTQQTQWDIGLAERIFAPAEKFTTELSATYDPNLFRQHQMRALCEEGRRFCVEFYGLVIDRPSETILEKAVAHALQRASQRLAQHSKGNFDIDESQFGSEKKSSVEPLAPALFKDLIAGWAKEKKPQPRTVYEWTKAFELLEKFLGHNDATKVLTGDLIRWKDAMVADGLHTRTIQNTRLSPVRAVFQWGLQNERLAANPAAQVTIQTKQIATERKRSFTDEEAQIILAAALIQKDPVRHWVPWLGAYTGARISELCQLRVEDVLQVDGIWCMKFDPDAGSLKNTSSERVIPIHPALLEIGFLQFVAQFKSGPLFPGLPPDKFGKRGGNGTKSIGRWVRSLGITDERLSPSHSWRHRIKTLGRRFGVSKDHLDAITGHGRASEGDKYGEFPMEALYRELRKIPILKL